MMMMMMMSKDWKSEGIVMYQYVILTNPCLYAVIVQKAKSKSHKIQDRTLACAQHVINIRKVE